jgi:hypothetical protein
MASEISWSEEGDIALLGWLDFCAQNNLSFPKTIADHLVDTSKDRGEDRFELSADQAESKFSHLCQRFLPFHEESPLKLASIINNGSRSLQLPQVIQQRVDTTVAKYDIIYAHMIDGEGDPPTRQHGLDTSGVKVGAQNRRPTRLRSHSNEVEGRDVSLLRCKPISNKS